MGRYGRQVFAEINGRDMKWRKAASPCVRLTAMTNNNDDYTHPNDDGMMDAGNTHQRKIDQ